jgi:hypothetical protein
MFKLSHRSLIIISGLVWFVVGCGLLQLGLSFLMQTVQANPIELQGSLSAYLGSLLGGVQEAVVLLIGIGMLVGYFKGRYVLGKSARAGINRILSLPNPTPLSSIYSAKYYILLAGMVGLGMSIKFLGVPLDVRGAIDVAIGAALINGAMVYFQHVLHMRASSVS